MSKFCHKVRNSSNLLFVAAAVSSNEKDFFSIVLKVSDLLDILYDENIYLCNT